ncbi:flagellar hook-length control protein FliK [Pusillimonas sp. SM2304]|uniref:flagellar hook-length control protein FliK n=1 Tax=Pusillimonas sp. SM2304 TaxID=3073241 RepID=UPI0028766DEA|nr:flagellar hook-length control protein FliK [Pusillimonas sp. SM2304]MDS1141136.1 flagellar hook-length control protein FliK [Pusillimonas sp. SM2304]
MHTSNISAVLPVAQKNAAHVHNDSNAEATSPDNRFSNVLTRQHSHEPAHNATSPAHRGADRKAPSEAKAEPAELGDEALAQAAAEQGLTLPQIALNIAAEVAAVRQSGLATALKHHGVADKAARTTAHAEQSVRSLLSRLPAAPAANVSLAAAQDQAGVLARKAAALADTLPGDRVRSTLLPAAAAPNLQPQHSPLSPAVLGAGKAASIAGAKQAVLTMQARMQVADHSQPKPASPFPEVFTALASAAGDIRTIPFQADAGTLQAAAAATMPGASAGLLSMQSNPLPIPGAQPQLPGIAAPLQSPQWGAELGRQVLTITQGGHNMPHTAELRLDPPELGPLRISINLNDNVAHAVFVSAHASVRQSVENALPQLQQMLAQAGISLGQTSVNDQGQPGQAFNETFGQGRGSSGTGQAANDGADSLALPAAARMPAANALVDTFA